MLKQAAGTIAARIVTTAMGLLVSVVAGHRLGVEGLGTIGLVALGVSLVALFAGGLGGGVLIYLVPRVPLSRLLPAAYGWAVLVSVLGYGVMRTVKLVPAGFELHVAALALLQAGLSIQTGVLLGRERIAAYNLVDMARSMLLLGIFLALALRPSPTAMDYVLATYAAFGTSWVISTIVLGKGAPPALPPPQGVMRLMVSQGLMVQGSNGLQLLLYRLSYWLIERYRGTSTLGFFVVANQLSEGAWLVPRSLAVVLYSKVSNTAGIAEQRRFTLGILKVSLASALLALVVLLVVPGPWFSIVFGPEVHGITPIIAILAPGVLALSASQAFSHFFSGTARNHHNIVASGIGLGVMAVLGFAFVPAYGLWGAAASSSVAYLCSGTYQAIAFMRSTGTRFHELWPRRADLGQLKDLLTHKR